LALDPSQQDRFHGRRRSHSADSVTKYNERKDKEIFHKLAAEQASNKQAPSTQSHSLAPAQSSFQLAWDGPWRQGRSGQGSRQGSGTNNGKHSDSNLPLI
jgi:hypothetical protein